MRYKLLKDLPTFKAGDVFDISSNGNLVKRGECISDCVVAYTAQTLVKFPNILEEWFEEIKDGPWKPKVGDGYYFISGIGYPCYEPSFCHDTEDDERLAFGNVFQTEDQAEKAVAWLKAFKVLRDDTKGFKPDWNSHEYDKFEVAYEYPHDGMSEGMLFANDCNHCTANIGLWFSSKTDAMNSIKNHRQEWLTFFGVESE